ncbi:MAG: ActS/PrrB/RegB family redox-sensitive histidine kinase [Pseudomonadota bacterium]
MVAETPGLAQRIPRENWIRLRTLVVLRWIAVFGQLSAIVAAVAWFDFNLNLAACLMAVAAAVLANVLAFFLFPENKRLTEGEAALQLVFDISQLSFLLFLTGGLNNPFSVLILVPVTISATFLQLRTTIVLGALGILLISFIALVHIPLTRIDGDGLRLPQDFVVGSWVAIVITIVFLAAFAQRITNEINMMADALTATQLALAREQKLTDLGGVVAAAAHELGTPLATIKLVSAELMEELDNRPELRDDAKLIRDQADRCRDILRSMGRAGKDDLHLRRAPIVSIIEEAAEPHRNRGKELHFELFPEDGAPPKQPVVERRPEIVHGIRNLVQNAVDFAGANVWIDISWSADEVRLRIVDDGPGFPQQILGRIGDPFVRRRSGGTPSKRKEYEGMGLGLFIAKTLLERTGAEISFANGRGPYTFDLSVGSRTGAIVDVVWPKGSIIADEDDVQGGLGQNRPIEA